MVRAAAWLGLCLALAGCASTRVDTSGQAAPPLCRADLSALVLWAPQWRPDQKDVADRELAAQRGIEKFFSKCFSRADVRRGSAPTDSRADRVVIVTVRELGPVIRLFASPALLEGGTEAVLEVKVLAGRETLADLRTHWQHGGPWYIKGVGALEEDMRAALAAVLTF